jgi:uncharacterized protein (DUF2141 family)
MITNTIKAMGRNTVTALIMTACTITATASAQSTSLDVTVSTVTQAAGEVLLAVYNAEDTFGKTSLLAMRKAAVEGDIEFSFSDLEPGEYAIMVFHDVNSNGELDTNLLGLPKEPWGASLQGKSIFGAPGWSDTRFELTDAGMAINITLR